MGLVQFVCHARTTVVTASALLVLGACAAGPSAINRPRPLVIPSGERVEPDSVRLDSIDVWVKELDRVIREDPSFLVDLNTVPRPAYPWETLQIRGQDTVQVAIQPGSDAQTPFHIYGFLHLMKRMDRLGEWFPDAAHLEGFDLERFILARTAESWVLGRSVYDTAPYAPLDEIVYAHDRGYLDAMILQARPEEFADTREAWVRENPDGLEEFGRWFQETFNREPPGPSGS